MGNVAIVFSTFNCSEFSIECLKSIAGQSHQDISVTITDDGSSDSTVADLMRYKDSLGNSIDINIIPLAHGERGVARKVSIQNALKKNPEYLFFIDADMTLEDICIQMCVNEMKLNPGIGALVIPEKPVSSYDNLFTKVKIFERTILNDAGTEIDEHSIEAARFWRIEAYQLSGGLNACQTAFEEIQPTIRFCQAGGKVKRAVFTHVTHNEKKATLRNIFSKKKSYFKAMDITARTEKAGFREMIKRWYFFRPVLYRRNNVRRYVKHPLLTLLLIFMYTGLSIIAVVQLLKAGIRIGKKHLSEGIGKN